MARGRCCRRYFGSIASTSSDSFHFASHTYYVVDKKGHKGAMVDSAYRKVVVDSLLQELDNVQVGEVGNVQVGEVGNVQVREVDNVQVGEAGNVQVAVANSDQVVVVDSSYVVVVLDEDTGLVLVPKPSAGVG